MKKRNSIIVYTQIEEENDNNDDDQDEAYDNFHVRLHYLIIASLSTAFAVVIMMIFNTDVSGNSLKNSFPFSVLALYLYLAQDNGMKNLKVERFLWRTHIVLVIVGVAGGVVMSLQMEKMTETISKYDKGYRDLSDNMLSRMYDADLVYMKAQRADIDGLMNQNEQINGLTKAITDITHDHANELIPNKDHVRIRARNSLCTQIQAKIESGEILDPYCSLYLEAKTTMTAYTYYWSDGYLNEAINPDNK